MQLKGLKINFLGDSITQSHGASSPQLGYVQRIGDIYGATVRNYGIGGTRFAEQRCKLAERAADFCDFVLRCDYMDKDADIVFVFGGTNDFGHGDAPFGKLSDNTPTTFCGAVRKVIHKLKSLYPAATLVFATPLPRTSEYTPRSDGQGDTVVLADYNNAIEAIVLDEGVHLLKLGDKENPRLAPFHDYSLLPDGLHPSTEGHDVLARIIGDYLLSL